MAQFEGGFNPNEHESKSFDILPAGDYEVVATSSSLEHTKDGSGTYFKFEFQVLNGPCQNRKVWHNFTWKNSNEKAVAIGKGQLADLCKAVGVLSPKDTSELHNKPLRIKVAVRKDEVYGDSNDVKGFKARHTGMPMQPQSSVAPLPPPQSKPGEEPAPWGE